MSSLFHLLLVATLAVACASSRGVLDTPSEPLHRTPVAVGAELVSEESDSEPEDVLSDAAAECESDVEAEVDADPDADLAAESESGAEGESHAACDEDEDGEEGEHSCGDAEGEYEGDDSEELAEAVEELVDPERRYTADISDEELQRMWLEDIEALGSISMGFANAGRMINSVPFPTGENWTIVEPRATYTLQEVVDFVTAAIDTVAAEHPGSPKLRVNHISSKDGGHLRPHSSHQNGRDVDLAFYYTSDIRGGFRGKREHHLDAARNWTLVRTLATETDVQVILVDNRIQRVIYNYALSIGEDKEWLDSLFGFRGGSLLKHARRHYDHYHVRFYAPRAQELGRRVQPLLAQRPEENRTFYRVRRGDTLGHIARRYGTSVRAIQRANGMRGSMLSVGRTLQIPLRKPCTVCPLPPVVQVPPRRLPPVRTAEVLVAEDRAVEGMGAEGMDAGAGGELAQE